MRTWLGLALLAVSWLLGLGYYQPASWPHFAVVVALGTVLLATRPPGLPPAREMGIALAMLLPAAWFMPWPHRAAPLLIAAGLALLVVLVPRRWPRRLGWGAVSAGVVLIGQALAMLVYTGQTARSHDLPWPLPSLLGGVASLLGIDAAVDGKTVVMHSMLEVHRLAATWELLLDPATLCFLAGGLTWLGITARSRLPEGMRWSWWIQSLRVLTLVVVAWLPVRAGLLMALYLHRALRADPMAPLTVMNQFLSPWVHLVFLLGPVLLAWWLVRVPSTASSEAEQGAHAGAGRPPGAEGPSREEGFGWGRYAAAVSLVVAGVAVIAFAIEWDPVGRPQDGRVMVVERHSTWEPTDRPYDTAHFGHDPSYSYTRIYDYCSQYYEMSRLVESDPINHDKLSQCDVLVVKTPTARYSRSEVDAIVRFVEAGGGLLLVGDHTNVFNSSTYLNDIARRFGFSYRLDLLFCIGSPYNQELFPPAVPHPVAQHLPPMYYAVSCSIDPGTSWGRAVVRSTGLWNLPPDYHADNYHPQAEYRPEMRYGAFIQLWAIRHGSGRVLAFTDSTIFSNFCTFQTGKAELMAGMLQWLNHTSPLDRSGMRWLVKALSLLAAAGLLTAGLRSAQAGGVAWLSLLAAACLGTTVGLMTIAAVHRTTMPEPKPVRPTGRMTRVVIDRTVSDVPLSLGADVGDETGRGYGLLEQWIPRLGYFTRRLSGPEAFSGDPLVILCPTRSVTRAFREGLVEYVDRGGKLLVVDSPDVAGSTANSLLWPFKMMVVHATRAQGELKLTDDWPAIPLQATCEILGGEPFLRVGQTPVAARTRYGQGSVMAIGFGSLFNDDAMGRHWMLAPDPKLFRRSDLDAGLLRRYDVLFALVEALVEDQPVTAGPPRQAEPEEPSKREAGDP